MDRHHRKLRVSCRKGKDDLMTPSNVETSKSQGQQAYPGMFGTTASLVVQVIQGKSYTAKYSWSGEGTIQSAFLVASWPANAPRPSISFQAADLSGYRQGAEKLAASATRPSRHRRFARATSPREPRSDQERGVTVRSTS